MSWTVITDNFDLFLNGALRTLAIGGLTILFSISLAIPLALFRESRFRLLAFAAASWSWTVRAVPVLVALYFTYYGLPFIGLRLNALSSAILAFTVTAAGYNMEFFRAGFRSVPPGQIEAARALGLSYLRTLRRVIFPQALRVTIPPLISNLTLLLKGSSLAGLVSVSELTGTAFQLIAYTFQPIQILLTVAMIYLLLNSILVGSQRWFENRWRAKGFETQA